MDRGGAVWGHGVLRKSSRYFPKRDELSLWQVFALPIDSSTRLATVMEAHTRSAVSRSAASPLERHRRYARRCLFVSVLPAPLSPEMTHACAEPLAAPA